MGKDARLKTGSSLTGIPIESPGETEMTKTEKKLTDAGFKIIKKFPGGRWFQVIAPDGESGAVLCQSFAAWHFFSEDHAATASSCSVERCHLDGLGDAIGTDSQMSTYRRLLQEVNVPKPLIKFDGVYVAIGQVYKGQL
jgi:hypothetical protein